MARIDEKNLRLSDVPFYILEEYFSTSAGFVDPDFPITAAGSRYNTEQRAQDYVIYLPDANTFNTMTLYAPSGAASANIIQDYSEGDLSGHNLDASFRLNRYLEYWQTSAASAEWQADVYIKPESKLYNWIIETYPSYVQTDKNMLYFGKIVEHGDSYIKIQYQGHRDISQEVIAKYDRTERFMVFLNAFFDRTQSLVTQKRQGLQFVRDIEEISEVDLNRIGRMLIDELFDENSEFYIPEAAKRLFLRELVNLLKKKGTYRPLYFLWDVLSWFRYNTIQIRELYHSEPIESNIRHYDKKFLDISGAIVRGDAALDTMAGYDEVLLADGVEMSQKAGHTAIPELIFDSSALVGVSSVGPVTVLDDSWIIDARLPGLIATDVVRKVPFYMINISLDESMMWGLPPLYENICYNNSFEITAATASPSAEGWWGNFTLVTDRSISGDISLRIVNGDATSTSIVTGRRIDVSDHVLTNKDFYPELVVDTYLPDGFILGGWLTSGAGYDLGAAVTGAYIGFVADLVFTDDTELTVSGTPVAASAMSATKWNEVNDVFRFPGKRIKFITPQIVMKDTSGAIYADVVYTKPWYTSGAIVNDIIANSIYLSFEKFKPVSHKSYYFLNKGLTADVYWRKNRESQIKEVWSIGQTSAGSASLPAGTTAASAVSAVKEGMYDDTYLPIHQVVLGQNGTYTVTGDTPLYQIPTGAPSATTYYDYGAPSGISAAKSRVLVTPVFEKKYYLSSGGDVQRVLIKVKIDSEDAVWFNELWLFDHDFKKLFFYSTFPRIYKPKDISILFNIVMVPAL